MRVSIGKTICVLIFAFGCLVPPLWGAGPVPTEECACPPDPSEFRFETYGIFEDPDVEIPVDLQGWSRVALSAGLVPDNRGYIPMPGGDFQESIASIRRYGTRVDLLVDLTGEGMGKRCWAGDETSFSIFNLADELARAVTRVKADGVLLKVPVSWVVAFEPGPAVLGGEGQCGDPQSLKVSQWRGQRVQNLVHRLNSFSPFSDTGCDISILVTCKSPSLTFDALTLGALHRGVDRVLIQLSDPSDGACRWEMALLNKSCALDLMGPEETRVIPVLKPGCLGNEGQVSNTFFNIALDLGFKGLALGVTPDNSAAFLSHNRGRLMDQDDFFAGLVWRMGLANTLCWQRPAMALCIAIMALVLSVVGLLALFFCPVRQLLGRYPRLAIGVVVGLLMLIWLFEAVKPTVNSWTNEAILMMLMMTLLSLFLVWLRKRQKARFP